MMPSAPLQLPKVLPTSRLFRSACRIGPALDVGAWLVLSVKRHADDDWELLGRRRTEAELVAVIQRQRDNVN